MRTDRLFALFALILFAGFCGVILYFVPRVDLTIVMLLCFALAGYDIWDQLFRARKKGRIAR